SPCRDPAPRLLKRLLQGPLPGSSRNVRVSPVPVNRRLLGGVPRPASSSSVPAGSRSWAQLLSATGDGGGLTLKLSLRRRVLPWKRDLRAWSRPAIPTLWPDRPSC